jgi:hypothetical protein
MNNKIRASWEKIEPDETAKKRMFDKILRHSGQTGKRKRLIFAAAGAALVLIICILAVPSIIRKTTPVTSFDPPVSFNALAPNLYATLYIPNDDYSALEAVHVECKNNKPDGVLDALIDYKVLPAGLHLNSYSITDDGKEYSSNGIATKVVGTLTAQMDLPHSFVEYLNGLTDKQEKAVTASLVNTFILRDNLKSITITIDGKPFVTNRSDHTGVITLINL